MREKNMGVLRDMAVSLLATELVAMELVWLLVEVWANGLTEQIVSSLRSFSSLPISQATHHSSMFRDFLSSALTFLFCLFHSSFINIMNFQTASFCQWSQVEHPESFTRLYTVEI